jgi:uncharacterized surface protein with fasciclin (FAS1) repeats
MPATCGLFASSTATGTQTRGAADIIQTAVSAGNFETLAKALDAAGLVGDLKGDGPFTVFAPTDEAFAHLPDGTLEALLRPENRDRLASILTYHVVPGRVSAAEASNIRAAPTLNGQRLSVGSEGGGLSVGGASVVAADIEASNGVIHVIDRVLLPREGATSAARALDLIGLAIERGARLFNRGETAACAAIYEVTARALLDFGVDLPATARTPLERALEKLEQTHGARQKAWVMRRGLDDAAKVLAEAA